MFIKNHNSHPIKRLHNILSFCITHTHHTIHCSHPIDVVKTRLQVSGDGTNGARNYKALGIRGTVAIIATEVSAWTVGEGRGVLCSVVHCHTIYLLLCVKDNAITCHNITYHNTYHPTLNSLK